MSLELIGENGKKQAMEESVFQSVLELGKASRRTRYSDAEAKSIGGALRDAAKRPPYNRSSSGAATLRWMARFFETCHGFLVEKSQPTEKKPIPYDESSLDPAVRAKRRAISQHVLGELKRLEEKDARSRGQGH